MTITPLDLAFGGKSAVSDRSFDRLRDRVGQVMPGLWDMATISDDIFCHSASTFQCGTMSIAAIAASPILAKQCSDVSTAMLFLPYAGERCTYSVKERTLTMTARSAVLLSGRKRQTQTHGPYSSGVHIPLDPRKLTGVANAMLGPDSSLDARQWIEEDRELSLSAGKFPLADLFRHQWDLINLLTETESDAGRMLGVDDQLYRLIAALLAPEKFLRRPETASAAASRRLEHVCDYIDAHLAEPLTLTTLEETAGMSRRNLQYAFLKRFGCTPMEWVRERRLDWAHRQLASAPPGQRIIDIALGSGFGHLANFSRRYRERFGEAPSETLFRGRRK